MPCCKCMLCCQLSSDMSTPPGALINARILYIIQFNGVMQQRLQQKGLLSQPRAVRAWRKSIRRPQLPCKVSQGGNDNRPLAPWALTFDLRERETLWTEENQARLVRIVASYELELELEEVERRLFQLTTILPGLEAKMAYIKPSLLAGLLRDPPAILEQLVQLKRLLPGADVGKLAVRQPQLLLEDINALEEELIKLRQLLGIENLDKAIEDNPRMLDVQGVSEVLEELRRLMPKQDPVALLLRDPSWLLRVERGKERLGQPPDEPC